jgi:hypothetical protein
MEETRQNYFHRFPLLGTLSDSMFNKTSFKAWADTTFGKDPLVTLSRAKQVED